MAELPPIHASLDGPFRTNVRQLLSEVGEVQPCDLAGTSKWTVRISDGQGGTEELLVFEEDVAAMGRLYCEQCRVIGWGHHPVSCSRFHFILPSAESAVLLDTGERPCPSCETTCPAVSSECPQCGNDLRRSSALEVQSHLLHGVLHSNGFGHLLRINGRERGSRVLSGTQLMDLWDRMCGLLKARDVTVQDLSKKYGLDLRLLHAVAYGSTWYGRWGYQFGRGSFGVTADAYAAAVALLQSLPLDTIGDHFALVDHQVVALIAKYRKMSGRQIQTLSELYRYMLEVRSKLPDGGGIPEGEIPDTEALRNRSAGLKLTGGLRVENGNRGPGRGGMKGSQANGSSRGILQGPPVFGVARARTQNARRPAKGFVFRLRIGLGKKSSSQGSLKLTKSQSPRGPGIKSPRSGKSPGLMPAKSPRPTKSPQGATPKTHKMDKSPQASPVKSPRRTRDHRGDSLTLVKPVAPPSSPRKRKLEPEAREGSPAPRRTRQRLEEEARVLGMNGAGFQRDGSLESEAVLRRKAKRTRLEEESGGKPGDNISLASPLGEMPPGDDFFGTVERAASPIPRETESVPAASGTRNGGPPRTPRTPAVRRTPKLPPRHRRTDPGEALQLSYSPPEKTPEREIGESGRAAGKPPIPEGSMSKLVRTFESSRESTRSPSVESTKSRYTPRRIDDAIKALVGIIRALPENTWMTRVSLKEKARTKIGDTGLLNYALRVVENLEVGGGAVVRRMVHPDSHVMEYRLESIGSGPSPFGSPCPAAATARAVGSDVTDHGITSVAGPGLVGDGPDDRLATNESAPTENVRVGVSEAAGAANGGEGEAALSVAPKTEEGGENFVERGSRGGGIGEGKSSRPTHVLGAAPLRGGAGSQSVRRSIELPDFDANGDGHDVKKRPRTTGTVAEKKAAQTESGWRVERPRRAIVSPQKVTPVGGADVSGPTMTKADVVKDLRYLHQHVVLTYKAARKIRRMGSVTPAPMSTPTTPFGGLETPLESTPLGSPVGNGAHLQLERGEGVGGDVAAAEDGKRERVTGQEETARDLREVKPVDGSESVIGPERGGEEGPKREEESEGAGGGTEAKHGDSAVSEAPIADLAQAPQTEGKAERSAAASGEREYGEEVGPQLSGLPLGNDVLEHCSDERLPKEEAAPGVDGLSASVLTPTSKPIDPVAVLRASKVIHNTKKFIKSYHGECVERRSQGPGEESLRVQFGVRLQDRGPNPRAKCDPPPELLILSKDATVKDLKTAAGAAFQEVYVMMTKFRVTRVDGWGGTSDKGPLAPLLARDCKMGYAQENDELEELHGKEEEKGGWSGWSEPVVKTEPSAELAGAATAPLVNQPGAPFNTRAEIGGSGLGWDEDREETKPASSSLLAVNAAAFAGALPAVESKAEPLSPSAGNLGGSNMDGAQLATPRLRPPSGTPPGSLWNCFTSLGTPGTYLNPASSLTDAKPVWNLTGTGTGAELSSEARFEAGLESWVVDCLCGTKDDDGERMAECDRCGTWMHTRCLKIRDRDDVPAVVVCPRCSPGVAPGHKGKGPRKVAKAPQKGASQPPSPTPTAQTDPLLESEQHLETPYTGLQLQSVALKNDAPKGPGERRSNGCHPGPSLPGTRKTVADGGPKARANVGEGDGGYPGEPSGSAQAQSGVKRKRTAAGGDRKVRNNLGHLEAAVRDMAGVPSGGLASSGRHVDPNQDNGEVGEGEKKGLYSSGKARSKRGAAKTQGGHPLTRAHGGVREGGEIDADQVEDGG